MTRKYLTQDEVYRLMDAAQSMSFPERNRCLIMMAFIHGFRASELLDLRLSDIDASGKQLNIRRIKNGFSTTHPLLPDEYNLIKLWLKQRKLIENGVEGDWLFLSRKRRPISRQHFFSIIREAGKRAGLAVKAHPHMLRHACGFALADNGVDTRLLQDYLGHRNIQHTVRYTASIEIFSILSDTQPVMLLVLKGCGKKSLVKTVPSDSKCQIPTFSSILP
ncbi:TPA: tyrosine-type recombinase/integrase [Escherichia coli]|nr:tyrosine-type recombinase/integrase [Escherichia coli]HCQ0637428.1 tyrosine-type recombinase/integrase [Escherichia coli]HCQ0860845.1 tyrosine-type recombinase/integrase [Escherichia coli]